MKPFLMFGTYGRSYRTQNVSHTVRRISKPISSTMGKEGATTPSDDASMEISHRDLSIATILVVLCHPSPWLWRNSTL